MRLLHVNTFELCEFLGSDVPPYAILSHRWGENEVTYREAQRPDYFNRRAESRQGVLKIIRFCDTVRRLEFTSKDGYPLRYIWADTCCIDKSSSAELSEAINSMFKWYARAEVCLVHLSDVSISAVKDTHEKHELVKQSEWFKRGWTLQELLAPKHVEFFDVDWNHIGDRTELQDVIQQAASISASDMRYFRLIRAGRHLRPGDGWYVSIARRMSWASKRLTMREEDIAYSLLGIFHINMPLLYGEGRHKAFARLQEEILCRSDDESIFAWGRNDCDSTRRRRLLAFSPQSFDSCGDVVCNFFVNRDSYAMTNKGLHIKTRLFSYSDGNVRAAQTTDHSVLFPLNCSTISSPNEVLVCPLEKLFVSIRRAIPNEPAQFARCGPFFTLTIDEKKSSGMALEWVYIRQ